MLVNDLYRSLALVACYDNGLETLTTEEQAEVDNAVADGEVKPPEGFSTEQQKKFNDALAREKGKWEAKRKAELTKQEKMFKDTLANNQNLTTKERANLEEQLATVQGELRTEKQQAQIALKELEAQLSTKLQIAEKRAQEAEVRYKESTIKRALQDAAVAHDAYRPEHLVKQMYDWTKLVDEKVVVDFEDQDPTTGEPIKTTRTPEDAVKRMKEKPEWAGFFKTGVVSGLGSSSAAGGLAPGADGKVDVRKLSPAQYRELREKNPEALGLPPKRK